MISGLRKDNKKLDETKLLEIIFTIIFYVAYFSPPVLLLVILWFQADPTFYVGQFIFNQLPIFVDILLTLALGSVILFKLGFFIFRFLVALIVIMECIRVAVMTMTVLVPGMCTIGDFIKLLKQVFYLTILQGRLLTGIHLKFYREILIPLYAAQDVIAVCGFMATLLTTSCHILANFAIIRLSHALPYVLWMFLFYLSITAFVTEVATFCFAADLNQNSIELLRKFTNATNKLSQYSRGKKIMMRQIKALRSPAIPIGFTGYYLFRCSRMTVLIVIKILLDQSINALITF